MGKHYVYNPFVGERKPDDAVVFDDIASLLSQAQVDQSVIDDFLSSKEVLAAAKDCVNLQRTINNMYWRRKVAAIPGNIYTAMLALSEFTACPYAQYLDDFRVAVIPVLLQNNRS